MILRLSFSFHGRINRAKYWAGVVTLSVLMQGWLIWASTPVPLWVAYLSVICFIPAFGISVLAVTAKRLHDLNLSGWWALVAQVTFILLGYIPQSYTTYTPLTVESFDIASLAVIGFGLFLGLIEGTQGQNRFGDDPLARPAAVAR